MFSTPRLPIQLLLKHKSTISLFLLYLMPPPPSGAPGSLVRGFKVRSSTRTPQPGHQACGGGGRTFGTLPSLSRATLRQRRCTINQVFACFCRRDLPGFYAEPHLRVQMRCSWFPIGHLPSYGESAHSVRPFQAVLPRAESPAVILLIPSKKKKGNWVSRAKTFAASAKAQITH